MEKTNFLDKFCTITGLDHASAKKLINTSKKSVLILNTLKKDEQKLSEIAQNTLLTKLIEFENVYLITDEKHEFTQSQAFLDGFYYIQNLSSILPVLALEPKQGEEILDMCSAPGGKAFNICRLTGNKVRLTVNESEKHRLQNLKTVGQAYNMQIEQMFCSYGQGLFRTLNTKFDKILLDAPCSAEGLIPSLGDENPKYWNQKKVKQLRNLQKKLINSAYHMLKDGGCLVYSTCTYSPEENEEVVNWLLTTYQNIELVEVTELPKQSNFVPGLTKWENKMFNKELTKTIRVLPTELYEGFFIAKLKKTSK